MKSPRFVFMGLKETLPNNCLTIFLEKIRADFEENNVKALFEVKDELLIIKIYGFSFYISFQSNQDDLPAWLQMTNLT